MNGGGRPATVVDRCHLLHAWVRSQGIPTGVPIRRSRFDELMACYGVSSSQVRNMVATGEQQRLWKRIDHVGSKQGYVVLNDVEADPVMVAKAEEVIELES